MRQVISRVCLAVLLTLPALAVQAGEPADDAKPTSEVSAACEALLEAHLRDAPIQVLSVESDLDEAVELRLERGQLKGLPDGVYVERQTRLDADGEAIDESLEVQSCGREGLLTNSSTTSTGGKIVYRTPRTWVPLPLAVDQTWTWSGETTYDDAAGRSMTADTTVEGKVVEKKKITVPAGEFEAYHLEVVVTEEIEPPGFGTVETYTTTYDSWITVEPHYLLLKRRVEFLGSTVELELQSVEMP